jgi:hypothetical protein
MKFNNVHQIVSANLTNIHKCLEKYFFPAEVNQKKFQQKKKIQFDAKKFKPRGSIQVIQEISQSYQVSSGSRDHDSLGGM